MTVTKENIKIGFKKRIANLINYFMKGLLVALPFAITYSIIKSIVMWLDKLFDFGIPAIGFVIVIVSIMLLGWIGTRIITEPLFSLIDDLLSRVPFVKIIYTSVKDFMEAFVGDKKKFTRPVLVEMSEGLHKPGFVTQDDLTKLNLPGLSAVYFPHSYAFSGNLFLVDKNKIKPFDGNPTEVMKFIVSGGVTDID